MFSSSYPVYDYFLEMLHHLLEGEVLFRVFDLIKARFDSVKIKKATRCKVILRYLQHSVWTG